MQRRIEEFRRRHLLQAGVVIERGKYGLPSLLGPWMRDRPKTDIYKHPESAQAMVVRRDIDFAIPCGLQPTGCISSANGGEPFATMSRISREPINTSTEWMCR